MMINDNLMTTQNNNQWEEVELDIPTFYKPKVKSEYPKALLVAFLVLGTVTLLLMSMHTAQTEAINGWVN